jgi:hypothetical protein
MVHHLVDDCRKQRIQPLFRDALKWRGRVHHGLIFDDVPYAIFLSPQPDLAGSWIRIGNMQLALSFDLFKRWPKPGHGWQVDSVQAYVMGFDSRRYAFLLMTPDRLIGTRGDMDAGYLTEHRLNKKQRRLRRRSRLIKQILPFVDDAWIAEHDAWVPVAHEKPKTWFLVHWNQVVGELATGKRQRKHEYVPPPPPPRMGRGKRPWHRRRWQRKPDRDEGLAQLHDLGHDDLEAMKSLFGSRQPSSR